ncbi:MAG: DUF503 domain-containing protein [Catenulispora sp.]
MFVGSMTLDILLGDVHSLKEKRGIVKPILAELDKRAGVGAAETGYHNLHRRAEIGVAVVAATAARVNEVLDDLEGTVAWRPVIELLGVRRKLRSDEDD